MEQLINYNPMLMMLYNLEPNILIISKCSKFDINEINLMKIANNLRQNHHHLKIAIMNMETLNELETGVYSPNTMVRLASNQNEHLNYFINYLINKENNNQTGIFNSIKSLLNVQKIIINPEFTIAGEKLNQKTLINIFGKDNVLFEPYLEPSNQLAKISNFLKNGEVNKYFETTKSYFQIKGEVVHGKELGRQLGFPTANVKVNKNILLKQGVYYTKIKLPNHEKLIDGMSVYWINEMGDYLVETYLFDFHKDIYSWYIELKFIDFIRDNVVVKNQEELIELLNKDAKWVKKHRI